MKNGTVYPSISKTGLASYRLETSQQLGMKPREVFVFFENPQNLSWITPPWLDFKVLSGDRQATLRKNAEFDYSIRWFGVRIPWRSRVTEYVPGVLFTDVQLRGPYRFWLHRHLFEEKSSGTLAVDLVDFTLPLPGLILSPVIRRQLVDIFSYRNERIREWASGRTSDASLQ